MNLIDILAFAGGFGLVAFAIWSMWPRKAPALTSDENWRQRGGLSPEGIAIGLAVDHADQSGDHGGGH